MDRYQLPTKTFRQWADFGFDEKQALTQRARNFSAEMRAKGIPPLGAGTLAFAGLTELRESADYTDAELMCVAGIGRDVIRRLRLAYPERKHPQQPHCSTCSCFSAVDAPANP